MPHPTPEELLTRLREARQAGTAGQVSRAQLERYRKLLEDCPSFAPAQLDLARRLLLAEPPEGSAEPLFSEVQQLLEHAVAASDRSAPALVELGHFLDSVRDAPEQAMALYEESAARALETLEDAWAGMLQYWNLEGSEESLLKASHLGALAEKLFPESGRIQSELLSLRQQAGQTDPGEPSSEP